MDDKKPTSFTFEIDNLSEKKESCKLFRPQFTGWGSPKAFTLQKLKDMGYLENKLILKVDVKVIEAVDEGAVTGNDMLDVRGFKVLYSQNLNLELEKEKGKSATCAAEVLLLEQTVSDLRVELSKEKKKSASSATEVLLLEQMVLDLKVELSKEKDKSATPNDLLEGVVSWEVLDYADIYTNEKGEE
ncbi:hypothetical protein YC2023_011228 [Brassica napus]